MDWLVGFFSVSEFPSTLAFHIMVPDSGGLKGKIIMPGIRAKPSGTGPSIHPILILNMNSIQQKFVIT